MCCLNKEGMAALDEIEKQVAHQYRNELQFVREQNEKLVAKVKWLNEVISRYEALINNAIRKGLDEPAL